MIDSKENYKFDLRVKGLKTTPITIKFNITFFMDISNFFHVNLQLQQPLISNIIAMSMLFLDKI